MKTVKFLFKHVIRNEWMTKGITNSIENVSANLRHINKSIDDGIVPDEIKIFANLNL